MQRREEAKKLKNDISQSRERELDIGRAKEGSYLRCPEYWLYLFSPDLYIATTIPQISWVQTYSLPYHMFHKLLIIYVSASSFLFLMKSKFKSCAISSRRFLEPKKKSLQLDTHFFFIDMLIYKKKMA